MTVGTQLAIAIDRASNQCQARMLTEYERCMLVPPRHRQIEVSGMPVSCLMFLIAVPCWKVESDNG